MNMPIIKENRMTNNSTTPSLQEGVSQTIFADRMLNFSMGHSITKLHFVNEISPNNFSPNVTIAIPTQQLIEALDFLSHTINDNDQVKRDLSAALDIFNARINRDNKTKKTVSVKKTAIKKI
jgi:hypothetical protein